MRALSRASINSRTAFRRFAVIVENVPSLGDSVVDGKIVSWMKQPGQFVAADEVVCVIETDKVAVDIRASAPGLLLEQLAKANDTGSF